MWMSEYKTDQLCRHRFDDEKMEWIPLPDDAELRK